MIRTESEPERERGGREEREREGRLFVLLSCGEDLFLAACD